MRPAFSSSGSDTSVVYHGTHAEFDAFSLDHSTEGGIFFSVDLHEAYRFAGNFGYVVEARLDVRNPMIVEGETLPVQHEREDIEDLIQAAKAAGHDGVLIKGFRDMVDRPIDTWIAFEPEQVEILGRKTGLEARNEAWRREDEALAPRM